MSRILPVPNGWKPAKIKDAAQVNPRSNSVDDDSLVTFLPMNAVSESGIIQGAEIRKAIDVKKGFTSFETGDVLVAKITPCFENYKGCLCTDLKNDRGYGSTEFHVLRPKKNITGEYLHILTRTHHFRGTGELNMTGTAGQKRVPTVFLKNYDFPLPPLPEQKAIADLLSTWDEAIEKTERLILVKEANLKGQIQRIMGEEAIDANGWSMVHLGDLFSEVTRKVGEKELTPYSISAGIGFVSQCEKWGKDISGSQHKHYTHLKAGEFSYNKGNSKRYQQGCVYLLKNGEICVPNVFISFKPKAKNVVPEFFEHYFIADYHARELKRYITSGARSDGLLNLNKKDFFKIMVPCPSPDEQKAIAEALTASQQEIDLLKQLADKYKTQKRGLMQKMLTGEWRVKPEIVNQYMEA